MLAATPDGALMQRAATGLATVCLRLLGTAYGRRVTLLVGTGNNGGDALFAGASLARPGSAGHRRPARRRTRPRSRARRPAPGRGAGGRRRPDTGLDRADLVVDGMLGIGGRGGLRPDAAALARAAAEGPGITVAVDVPSGVDADTGAVEGDAFLAMHTVTFGAVKLGLVVGEGRGHAGQVHLVDIGLGPYLPPATAVQFADADVAARLPVPSASDDKYSQGVVGIVAGSATYPGAAVLCTGAALRTRPGLVRYAGTAADGVRAAWPEAIVTDGRPADAGRVQAWVVGPGMGTDDDARERARRGPGHRPPRPRGRRRADPAGRGTGPGPRPHRARPSSRRTTASSRGSERERTTSVPTAWARPAASPPTSAAPSC